MVICMITMLLTMTIPHLVKPRKGVAPPPSGVVSHLDHATILNMSMISGISKIAKKLSQSNGGHFGKMDIFLIFGHSRKVGDSSPFQLLPKLVFWEIWTPAMIAIA